MHNIKEIHTIFKITYMSMSVLGGDYQKTFYDSATNTLAITKISASSTPRKPGGKAKMRARQTHSQAQSSKKISDSDKDKLVQTVIRNGFFQTDVFYPPDPTWSQDYTVMILGVNLDGKLHTVIWTDTSKNMPIALNSVVESIQEIASK